MLFFYKKFNLKLFYFAFILWLLIFIILNNDNKINNNKIDESSSRNINNEYINNYCEKCYLIPDNYNIKVIHLIITRFVIEFWKRDNFTKIIFRNDYLLNGIRVMKKYLIPSLENQSCKKFIWILMVGNKVNITNLKYLLNLNVSFKYEVVYQKDIKNFIRNISKGEQVLITSRIDYDDRIYYDAVNDVRKSININKPIFLYGYNSGLLYYESDNKYYIFNRRYGNNGVMSIFISLIIVLNKVNDTYIVYDFGHHPTIRKTILNSYKSLGIEQINYELSNFDSGVVKFVWVRHNYSGQYIYTNNIKKNLKLYDFNLNKFYGKY